MANPRLILLLPDNSEREFKLSGSASIGRAADNSVCLPDETVSRYHAIVEERGGHFWLGDLGSAQGTTVNGAPIKAEHCLRNGDMINVGGSLKLRFLEDAGASSATKSNAPPPDSPASPPPAGAILQGNTRISPPWIAISSVAVLLVVIAGALTYKYWQPDSTEPEDGDGRPSIETPRPSGTFKPPGIVPSPGVDAGLNEIRNLVVLLATRINDDGQKFVFEDEFLRRIQLAAAQFAQSDVYAAAEANRGDILKASSFHHPPLLFILAASRSRFNQGELPPGCGVDPGGVGLWKLPRAVLRQYGKGESADSRTVAETTASHLKELMFSRRDDFMYGVACFGEATERTGGINENTSEQQRLNFWKLVREKVITEEEANRVVCFFAAGIVAENPNHFGLMAKSLRGVYN